jgi:hypothetical protein
MSIYPDYVRELHMKMGTRGEVPPSQAHYNSPASDSPASVKAGIKGAYVHFAETTTFGGAIHTYVSPHAVWRATWVLIVCFTTSVTIWNSNAIVQDYLTYPVVTTVELADQNSIPYPTVTLCNRNPVDCIKLAFAYIKDPFRLRDLMSLSRCKQTLVTQPLRRRLVSSFLDGRN